ncbi:MAG: RNA polymerase sigma factor [bacterium]
MRHAPSQLVDRMLEGDRTSFDDIVAWYSQDVLRLSYLLLRDEEEAKDILQESMLRLVRLVKEKRLRRRNGSIQGFLMTAARNLCIDRLKKRIDFYSFSEEMDSPQAILYETYTPSRAAEESQFQDAFQNALSQLTGAQRTILVLHQLQEVPQSDIAKMLHLSIDCVRTHLYRARKKMRVLLEPLVGE